MEDTLEKISGFIIDVNYSSPEEISEMAKLWELEEIHIEKGPFQGYLHGIHTPHIQIIKDTRSHGTIIKGKTPANCYTFNYTDGIGKITHNGLPLTSSEILVLDDSDEIDFTSKGASYDVTIVIEKEFFEKIYTSLYGQPFIYNREKNRIELIKNKEHSFEYDLDRWTNYLIQNLDEWINDSVLTEEIEINIIETFCSHLGNLKDHKPLKSAKDAIALYHYIDRNYREDITIKEICDTFETGERSVRSSFKKIFGFSPKEYLSRYRLGKFRNSLIKNLANNPSITRISSEEGLSHPSRLAQQYKEMFGHLPSDRADKEKTDRRFINKRDSSVK